MKRKRRSHNPFSMYAGMFQAGIQMAELFNSSAQVVSRRGELIARAMKGELPFTDKEFITMWQEKFFAGNESFAIALKQINWSGPTSISLNGLMRIMGPYRQKASANAKRLNKRKDNF